MDIAPAAPLQIMCGERVWLGPLQRDLVPVYYRWSNDLETSRTLGLSWPATLEQETARFEQRSRAVNAAWFTLYERESDRPIGLVYLYEIEPRHARAIYGILIGEADCRGRGYGTEATRLMLDYAFTALGLENVLLTVLDSNPGGIRAYEKAGFRVFGRRTRCSRGVGTLSDLIYMEALAPLGTPAPTATDANGYP